MRDQGLVFVTAFVAALITGQIQTKILLSPTATPLAFQPYPDIKNPASGALTGFDVA